MNAELTQTMTQAAKKIENKMQPRYKKPNTDHEMDELGRKR